MKRFFLTVSAIATSGFVFSSAIQPPRIQDAQDIAEDANSDAVAELDSFELPPGQWVSQGELWAFSDIGPVDSSHLSVNFEGLTPPLHAHDTDRSVMTLVKAVMSPTGSKGEFNIWTATMDGFHATAITALVDGEELPIRVRVGRPADDGLWLVLCADRVPESSKPMLVLPDYCDLAASRVGEDQTQCQWFDCRGSIEQLTQDMQQLGWVVDKTTSQHYAILSISQGDERHEISYFASTETDQSSILIRRVSSKVLP